MCVCVYIYVLLQLVDAICRPPRDVYTENQLVGGMRATFAFAPHRRVKVKKYYREDVELVCVFQLCQWALEKGRFFNNLLDDFIQM